MKPVPGTDESIPTKSVLVIGSTGYIGSRLVPRLLDNNLEVRVLVRNPEKLKTVPWRKRVTVFQGGLSDHSVLVDALSGVDVACHLVHSMGNSKDFERHERDTAHSFVDAAETAGVRRVVHLSGLHPRDTSELSPHLRSRLEVSRILLSSRVPAMVLQAGVVIGSGSASFELIRHLTSRLPFMITPKWAANSIQPISISDTIHYISAAIRLPFTEAQTVDIGGPDVLQYRDMMQLYAAEAGLHRRIMLTVPVLTPKLSSLWMGLVTPVPSGLAAPLVESMRCEAVATGNLGEEILGSPPRRAHELPRSSPPSAKGSGRTCSSGEVVRQRCPERSCHPATE
ncbi:NAD(P)H-binding protein [Dietzia sp.]|uniref:NAD(P)H-binding protein n=1 Tax=Dietzia sp. TaxID=1871616 RepID=UPI002FD9BF23